ncbi:Ataxin-10 [Gonapodya sp. JEL0774]|nr:Ataxin-10 [Gonapodya sp. JEL0774]
MGSAEQRALLELLLGRFSAHLTSHVYANGALDMPNETFEDPANQLIYAIFSNAIELGQSACVMDALRPLPGSASILTIHQLSFLKILDGKLHSASSRLSSSESGESISTTSLPVVTVVYLCRLLHSSSSRTTDYLFGLRDTTGNPLLIPNASANGNDNVAPTEMEGLVVIMGALSTLAENVPADMKEIMRGEGIVGDLLCETRTKISTESADAPRHSSVTTTPKSPLFMLKTDVVRLLSNLTYKCPGVQDEIRERDAIPLILEQCNLDDVNPFLREHAILLIRNLCDGNAVNQAYIRSLEAQKVVVPEEVLDKIGGELEIDAGGKLTLKKHQGNSELEQRNGHSRRSNDQGSPSSRFRELV